MEHRPHTFTPCTCQPIFVSIIGKPSRRAAASFSRKDALDDLIAYLNMMMAEEVLSEDATEEQVRAAIEENLYESVEIIECE